MTPRAGARQAVVRARRAPDSVVGLALLTPALILLALAFLWPLLRLVWLAFTEPSVGLVNFRDFFGSPARVQALFTTLRVSAIVTLLSVGFGMMISWELRNATAKWKRVVLWSAAIFPLWTGIIVRNYAMAIIMQRFGLLNSGLQRLGVIQEPLDLLYTETAVIIGMVYSMVPFATLPLYGAFADIGQHLLDASHSLGASRIRTFRSIILPISAPSIFAATAIVFVISMGFYITPILLGGPQSQFLATVIDRQIYDSFDLPGGAATACVLFAFAIAIVSIAWRMFGYEKIKRVVG